MKIPFLALAVLAGLCGPMVAAYGQYYHQAPPPGYAPYPAGGMPAQYAMPMAGMPAYYSQAPMPTLAPAPSAASAPAPLTADSGQNHDNSQQVAQSAGGSGSGCNACRSDSCGHCCAYKCDYGACVHRTGFFGEYMNLQVRGVDQAYGVAQDGIGGLGTVPVGRVGTTDFDNHSGFRAGFTVALDCTSSITATYTSFESDVEDALVSPVVIQPLVAFPGTFNAGFTAQAANAVNHVDFQFIDVDYRAILRSGKDYYVNYLLGARYAQLTQEFSALFPFAPPNGATLVETEIGFDGGGIRFGLDGERQLCAEYGLGTYAKLVGSLVAGQSQASYLQVNQFNGIEATTQWEDSRLMNIWEIELGLSWTSGNGMLRLTAGYYVAIWGNVVTTPEYINAVQTFDLTRNGNYTDVGQDANDTITFDGIVARLEINL